MSYETKIEAVKVLVEQHGSSTVKVEGEVSKVNWALFIKFLVEMGGTSEAALASCSYEDLAACGLPKLLAKQAAVIFRGESEVSSPKTSFVTERTAERMTVEELIARYNPKEENAVSKRLKLISRGLRFIVFAEGITPDIPVTHKLINEIQAGYGERTSEAYSDGGTLKRIYRVGEIPNNLVDENPLYPGRALRPDGTCDQLNRSWEGVPLEIRQLLYLAVKETKEAVITVTYGHTLLDTALGRENGSGTFRNLFQKAALLWSDKKVLGTLPPLKIQLGASTNKNSRVTIIA